jgi:anti-anti-sigma factor
MDINTKRTNDILQISVKGRLDAFGALELDDAFNNVIKKNDIHILIDMKDVHYLSSAGIRVLLQVNKKLQKRGGDLHLCHVNQYPSEVLEMTGLDSVFLIHSEKEKAVSHITQEMDKTAEINWNDALSYTQNNIELTVYKSSQKSAILKAVGDISKVLFAQLEQKDIYSRKFSETEYSIGLGALGDDINEYMQILGEMITIGGTMVWLPTDGHDTPDFLTPYKDTGNVTIHTGFNAALEGDFNDIMIVKAKNGESFTISALYAAVFNIARQTQPNFNGVISTAMQADLDEFYSSGVKIAPVKKFAPENHQMITHKDNFKNWMDINSKPQYHGETMLSFGVGMDLSGSISTIEKEALHTLFYLNPANTEDNELILHNHAVIFKHITLKKTCDLDKTIKNIVNNGKFMDMRHLLDNTKIKQAVIGVSYITDIVFENE